MQISGYLLAICITISVSFFENNYFDRYVSIIAIFGVIIIITKLFYCGLKNSIKWKSMKSMTN